MEAPDGVEMTETVIETGLEATIEQIIPIQVNIRGTSILGEVRNVEIPGPTQQLLCSKYHDFLAIFALNSTLKNQSNCIIFG